MHQDTGPGEKYELLGLLPEHAAHQHDVAITLTRLPKLSTEAKRLLQHGSPQELRKKHAEVLTEYLQERLLSWGASKGEGQEAEDDPESLSWRAMRGFRRALGVVAKDGDDDDELNRLARSQYLQVDDALAIYAARVPPAVWGAALTEHLAWTLDEYNAIEFSVKGLGLSQLSFAAPSPGGGRAPAPSTL